MSSTQDGRESSKQSDDKAPAGFVLFAPNPRPDAVVKVGVELNRHGFQVTVLPTADDSVSDPRLRLGSVESIDKNYVPTEVDSQVLHAILDAAHAVCFLSARVDYRIVTILCEPDGDAFIRALNASFVEHGLTNYKVVWEPEPITC